MKKEKLVDLNGRENCTTAVITIQDKTFKISRIVTGVRVMYSNVLKKQSDFFKELSEVSDKDKESALALSARWESFAEELPSILLSVIELLLVKNGYEYTEDWWRENCDLEDYRNFIDASLSKDTSTTTFKKKV